VCVCVLAFLHDYIYILFCGCEDSSDCSFSMLFVGPACLVCVCVCVFLSLLLLLSSLSSSSSFTIVVLHYFFAAVVALSLSILFKKNETRLWNPFHGRTPRPFYIYIINLGDRVF
jgi:ABC-type transport system involved in multi-copper enzyme maturation permease subunit